MNLCACDRKERLAKLFIIIDKARAKDKTYLALGLGFEGLGGCRFFFPEFFSAN